MISYAAVPGMPYLGFLAMEKSVGAEMILISYRNPIGSVPDLMEGRISIAVVPLATVLGPIQSGKMKALTVMSPQRALAAPEVPSLSEAGYGDLAFVGGLGLFASKEMPAEQRQQIETAVRSAVAEPETAERLATLGYRPHGGTSAEFATLLQLLSMRARAVAQAYGARPSQ
jgi:tripartite-type tricarboxylate transporter receptor subunit TctC